MHAVVDAGTFYQGLTFCDVELKCKVYLTVSLVENKVCQAELCMSGVWNPI